MKLNQLVSTLALAFAVPLAIASTSGVVISQVYGAGGNTNAVYKNDFVELFNAGNAPVNLNGWSVQYASGTTAGTSWSVTALPNVSLQPGQYFLVQQAAGTGGTQNLPTPDKVGNTNMGGAAGKVLLATTTTAFTVANPTGATVVDFLGYATTTGYEGAAATGPADNLGALRRAGDGCVDTNNNAADFSVQPAQPRNTLSPLNVCSVAVNQPIVPVCADGSAISGSGTQLTMTATDADSIVNGASVQGTWPAGITLGSFSSASGNGGQASQQVLVGAGTAPGNYSLTLSWANNAAQTASCSFHVNVTGVTPIYQIQGSGSTSPYAGQTVTTQGVVTKLNNNGFFMQDAVGDGNPATSDGIFVFTSTAPTVSVGQLVRLTATVTEFNTGAATNASTLAHTVTELTNPSGITVAGTGYAITPVEVDLSTLATDGLEAYEGMLVKLRGPLTVQQNYFLGRYGQLTIAAGGRVQTPTNHARPGPAAQALAQDNERRTVLLDDGTSLQNPNPTPYIGADNTVRAGDTTGDIVGVIDYGLATSSTAGLAAYKIHPTVAPTFSRDNPRTASPTPDAGNIRVASANVLNFFTTFTNGQNANGQSGQGCSLGGAVSASNCRGADNLAEFQRQRAKTVAELIALNADVVGLMEIQNQGNTAVQNLVDGINAQLGAGTYASVALPTQGTGDDAIRVAMIYKPGKLTAVGSPLSDTAAINNRPPLAQTFAAANGERFAVVVNHLKSKGSCPSSAADPDADQDDGQGCWNDRRRQQAARLNTWLGTVQAAAGTNDVVLLGDFNAYAQEDPIFDLKSFGLVDAVGQFDADDYSYVFDGAAGRLDHGLVTPSLASKVVSATSWHVNADEPSVIDYNTEFKQPACATCGPDYYSATPFRSSDHDPMVMGLSIVKRITGTVGRDTLVGTPGDDAIEGGAGADTLTGNGGRNQFVYRSVLDGTDTITDFTVGADTLVLTDLLASLSINVANPWAQGYVTCTATTGGALIGIDTDAAGPLKSRPLVRLLNQSCANLSASSFKF